MKDERTRASRRRFREGQLKPVLRPMAVGCAVPLVLFGWIFALLAGIDWGTGANDLGVLAGWTVVAVGLSTILWAWLSGRARRCERERAREERAWTRKFRGNRS